MLSLHQQLDQKYCQQLAIVGSWSWIIVEKIVWFGEVLGLEEYWARDWIVVRLSLLIFALSLSLSVSLMIFGWYYQITTIFLIQVIIITSKKWCLRPCHFSFSSVSQISIIMKLHIISSSFGSIDHRSWNKTKILSTLSSLKIINW